MSTTLHKKDLIKDDIDKYSKALNLHKDFLTDNIKKTYYCLTWYFESDNLEGYFKNFVNNLLELFEDNIVELTANLEKSNFYHIHVAIMFNRTFPIVFRLNRIYKDINIETILCSNYENIKAYCSKEFSRVKHINPIIWSKNNSLKLAQSDKVLDSANKSVLKTAMIVELKELLTLYIKNCNTL